jgi:PAS domain S-box-containing protein
MGDHEMRFPSKQFLLIVIAVTLACLVALIAAIGHTLVKQNAATERLNGAISQNHQSHGLAHQLRQSSDELTRMVRTYAATGESRFKDYFYEILDIRDGKAPRPDNYDHSFWDFRVVEKPAAHNDDGQSASLHRLMEEAGFSAEEFVLLEEAKRRSDRLVKLEETAMNAVEGKFRDEAGAFTIERKPDRELALRILFSEEYLQAKSDIMRPINDFLIASDSRTSAAVTNAQRESDSLHVMLVSLLGGLLAVLPFFIIVGFRYHGVVQDELQESENRFRVMFEQAPVGLTHTTIDGTFLHVNDKYCDILGYTHDELLKLNFSEITHPDDRAANMVQVDRLLRGECDSFAIEKRYFQKSGAIVWVGLTVSLLRDEGGAPHRLVAVIQDITVRKRAQQERDRILETSKDLICIAGADGRFQYLSPAWMSLGYTEDELRAKPFMTFVHPDDRARTQSEVEKLIAGESSVNFVNRYIDKGGNVHYLEWIATPVPDSDQICATARDVTARREAASERNALRGQIAHISRVNAMGELTAALAHEINQPLGAILNNAQAASRFLEQDSPDLDEVREALEDIASDDKRAGEIVRRLRQMVRTGTPDYESVRMREVIKEVISLIQSELILKQVSLHTYMMKQVMEIDCDRIQIQQVLLNLITNGIDAMTETPREERDLRIRMTREDDHHMTVSVRDHGAGMSAESIETVFQPFYTTKDSGMGMGLAISRTIIEAHKGKLWAKINSDKGMTFGFTVPCERSSE